VAVLVRQGLPPADVRGLIQDPQQGCREPAAGLGGGVLLGRLDDGDGQGGDERPSGADTFAGEAVERALLSLLMRSRNNEIRSHEPKAP
jgi:hypothetical protein